MVDARQHSSVYTMPLSGREPLAVPISEAEAITEAVKLTLAQFGELTALEIVDPAFDTPAEIAHWVMLLVVDGAGVAHSAIAEELNYGSEADVRAEHDVARVVIEEEDNVRLRFDIINTKYHRFLRGVVVAAAEQPQELPSTPQQPALTSEECALIASFRDSQIGAEEALEHQYLELIIDLIDGLGPDAPDEAIDVAVRVLKDHAMSADVNSSASFTDALLAKIKDELETLIETQGAAELTLDLDFHEYYDELRSFEATIDMRRIKSSLDSAKIGKVTDTANKYFERRFEKGSEEAIPEFARMASTGKRHLATAINEAFITQLTRYLKLSARMYERELKNFHLAQLPQDRQEVFYGIVLEEITLDKVERYLRRPRHRQTNRRP